MPSNARSTNVRGRSPEPSKDNGLHTADTDPAGNDRDRKGLQNSAGSSQQSRLDLHRPPSGSRQTPPWFVFEGETDYIRRCFEEYSVKTDPSGRCAYLYKRWHLIGLEAGISVASVGLRGEATGGPTGWRADAVAVAKRDLKTGEILDGEGGYTVVGRLMPSETSLRENCLPLGLAHGWKLLEPVAAGQPLRWSTIAFDPDSTGVRLRREMDRCVWQKRNGNTLTLSHSRSSEIDADNVRHRAG